MQIVATATLGALVGYECLGTYIVAGLARGPTGRPEVLAGAILVAALALTVDLLLNSTRTGTHSVAPPTTVQP